jgi:hypothetical protein
VVVVNKDFTQSSQRVRDDGYIYGSGGRFMSKSGEVHYDPRYG